MQNRHRRLSREEATLFERLSSLVKTRHLERDFFFDLVGEKKRAPRRVLCIVRNGKLLEVREIESGIWILFVGGSLGLHMEDLRTLKAFAYWITGHFVELKQLKKYEVYESWATITPMREVVTFEVLPSPNFPKGYKPPRKVAHFSDFLRQYKKLLHVSREAQESVKYVDIEEASRLTGLSRENLRQWVHQTKSRKVRGAREIPFLSIGTGRGRRLHFPKDKLLEWYAVKYQRKTWPKNLPVGRWTYIDWRYPREKK